MVGQLYYFLFWLSSERIHMQANHYWSLHLKQKAMMCLTYKQCFGQFWLFKARKQLDHLQKAFFGKDSLGQMVLTLSNPWILLLYFRSLLPRERWMHLVPWRKPLTLFQSHLLPFSCDTCRRWLQSQLRRTPLSCSLFLLTSWAGFCQTKRAEVLENLQPNWHPLLYTCFSRPFNS